MRTPTVTLALTLALFACTVQLAAAMPLTFSLRSPFQHTHRKRDTSTPKVVVAHHMVGNTYPYTPADWAQDIEAAHAAGIDAFALNIGTDDWQPGQVASAYVFCSFVLFGYWPV